MRLRYREKVGNRNRHHRIAREYRLNPTEDIKIHRLTASAWSAAETPGSVVSARASLNHFTFPSDRFGQTETPSDRGIQM